MFNRQVEALLTICALSIFADKRVFASEITAFVQSAAKINTKVESDIVVTEAKLLMWFELNRVHLHDKVSLKPVGFKHWFETVLSDLKGFKDAEFVVEILNYISLADGELHVSERALSVLVDTALKNQMRVSPEMLEIF